MEAGLSVLLLLLAAMLSGCRSPGEAQQSMRCGIENGPSAELEKWHNFTPSDLDDISAQIVETDGAVQLNITWTISADASIRDLNATKLCISTYGHPTCIRCDYTKPFESQTRHRDQKWQFYYVGFPVEENTNYFIDGYNLPPANPYEDIPSKSVTLKSPGSLWDPNITVCKMDSEIEVSFTTSNLSPTYAVLICQSENECSDKTLQEISYIKKNDTRISERIPVNSPSSKNYIELIPYFPRCDPDCPRHSKYQLECTVKSTTGPIKTLSVEMYVCIIAAVFVKVCIIAIALYVKKRHGTVLIWPFPHPSVQLIPIKILLIYPPSVCIHHTVLAFAEFLRERCQSDVIVDVWQKRRIADIGPVQWLAVQKELADKVIFFSPSRTEPACDSACKTSTEGQNENSESMFTLAYNLFCSDWKNHSSLHKYMVVSFSDAHSIKSLPSALTICRKYFLMKDFDSFLRELYPSAVVKAEIQRTAIV
ncbi:interleukin-17 receptor B isoform X2 [Sphaerodactylus townsendi]|uniref:interleukin-17 receptor B isoform X2 n=1 Tax=Sphaerodactylus townsendi TaxID=933632 RepID=UPI0020267123|nr:interleukin-17 receptor B isoform X2 [Sphaerodactylus townsendi]